MSSDTIFVSFGWVSPKREGVRVLMGPRLDDRLYQLHWSVWDLEDDRYCRFLTRNGLMAGAKIHRTAAAEEELDFPATDSTSSTR